MVLLQAILPYSAAGLVICVEPGPGGHVAVEWGPCAADAEPCAPGADVDCRPCVDIPVIAAGGTAAPAPRAPDATPAAEVRFDAAALPLPAAAGIARSAALPAPAGPPPRATPLRL
jgi:hypothetical protein